MTDGGGPDPLIGSFFNNYRIDELLAQGGMGAVYLVRDATLPNIRKVLKVILPEFANNAFIRERFLREAEAVSVLKHSNIVGIDAIGALPDGRLCMLIPFLEGKPLDQFIAEHGGRLAPHRVMHIIAHIARGLDHAHRQGIVHRDLKPGNVFVEPTEDDRYFCKVLDFGIAKQLNARAKRPSPTLAGPVGTPCYMAVEQYANAADVTAAADVFALAIMVWQMVTGCLPWGEQDPAVLYQKQLHEPPSRPVGNHLSSAWETILRTAFSPDPRLRPQSMRQLVQALASALPAIEPLFPSGAEILRNVARNLLVHSAHDDETVRNQSDRPLVPAWPVRETPLPAEQASGVAAPPEAPASVISSSPPTANERRGALVAVPHPSGTKGIAAHPTTLGALTGAIEPRPARARRKRALLGLVAAGSVGVAAFALAVSRAGGSSAPNRDAVQRPIESLPPTSAPAVPAITLPPPIGAPHAASGSAAQPVSAAALTAVAPTENHPTSTPAAPAARSAAPDRASAAPAPVASQRMPPTERPASRRDTPPNPESASSDRLKPKVSPAKPIPNRARADPPSAGSGAHHFDPNAVGGQEKD